MEETNQEKQTNNSIEEQRTWNGVFKYDPAIIGRSLKRPPAPVMRASPPSMTRGVLNFAAHIQQCAIFRTELPQIDATPC